jgi:hypothetical protein
MTWYRDLDPCDYFGESFAHRLKAIGWLFPGKPIPTGEVSEAFFEKLCQLLQNPWNPVSCLGFHDCAFCRFTGAHMAMTFTRGRNTYQIRGSSTRSLFVPGNEVLYVAPELIAHYIDVHGYCPPEEFREAAMACPERRSAKYLQAIFANGGRGLIALGRG